MEGIKIYISKCSKKKKGLKKTKIMINSSGKVSESDRIMRVTVSEPII